MTIDLTTNEIEVNRAASEPWRVTLVDTGLETMTGGRLKRVRDYIGDEPFCLTYGDGVCDVDITALIAFHKAQGVLATVTAVQQPGRFGALDLSPDATRVERLPREERHRRPPDQRRLLRLRAGGDRLRRERRDRLGGGAAQALVSEGQLAVYRHTGFWQNMDTLRDKHRAREDVGQRRRALEGLGPGSPRAQPGARGGMNGAPPADAGGGLGQA